MRRFFSTHAEPLLFGAAMALLLALGTWWYLLAQRLTTDYFALLREKVVSHGETPHTIARELVELDQKIDRRLFMLGGEAAFFCLLLAVIVGVLFVLARQKRRAFERMQRMLQMTSHELKTPIAGVKALLQSLERGSIPDSARSRMIAQGVAECDRLEHLTEGLLAYQRALARIRSQLDVCAPGALVSRVLEERARTFGDEAIITRLEQAETPVMADRDAFRVILENLLDNAKKFGAMQPIELYGAVAGDRYVLRVSDRGVGFEPTHAERLFAPFERGDADQRGIGGSGLGLYIARALAEGQGGGLTGASAGRNQGSTFTVSLRVAPAGQRPAHQHGPVGPGQPRP